MVKIVIVMNPRYYNWGPSDWQALYYKSSRLHGVRGKKICDIWPLNWVAARAASVLVKGKLGECRLAHSVTSIISISTCRALSW